MLVVLELVPDCETGIITLSVALFDGYGSVQLGPIAREDVAAAMTTYLSRLRRLPALWGSLEGIEIRGHTDPRAIRNPYATNMVGSQQRALAVLLFLVGPDGLTNSDRVDLERLATVSGTSFSRPPASCPERTPNCYPESGGTSRFDRSCPNRCDAVTVPHGPGGPHGAGTRPIGLDSLKSETGAAWTGSFGMLCNLSNSENLDGPLSESLFPHCNPGSHEPDRRWM